MTLVPDCANRDVADDTRVISSDTDNLWQDVEWNAIRRFNVLLSVLLIDN
jgi:hypothetical protein